MIGSCGESNTRCSARVSSTTPRFGPRCPPVAATLWIRNSRISCASSLSCAWERCCRSAGPRICSSIRSVYARPYRSVVLRVPDVGHAVLIVISGLTQIDPAIFRIAAQQDHGSQYTCDNGPDQHTDLDVRTRRGAVTKGELTDQ